MAGTRGVRARNRQDKRAETLARITDVSIALFSDVGYDATTFDAIAEAAGLSRRSLFNYFDSKDAILLAHLRDLYEMIADLIAQSPPDGRPLDAVCAALIGTVQHFGTTRIQQVSRIIGGNAALKNRVRSNDSNLEGAILSGLETRWPQPDAADRMNLIAMMGASAMRFAVMLWWREDMGRPLPDCITRAFEQMAQVSGAPAAPGPASRRARPARR